MSVISSFVFLIMLFIVTLLYFLIQCNWSLFTGLILGYLFSLIGFFILYYSVIILMITWNIYWYLTLFFVRLLVYFLPMVIYAITNEQYFNIICLICGLSVCSLTSLLINIKVVKHNKRREVEISV